MKNYGRPHRGYHEVLAMRIALIVWLILLIALCLAPVHVKHELKTTGRLHAGGHIVAFCVTSFLLLWHARSWPLRMGMAIAAVVLAFGTEYWETALYHNPLEWIDIQRDLVGILLGFVFSSMRSGTMATADTSRFQLNKRLEADGAQ